MTRMGNVSEGKRECIEDTLSNLGVARVLIKTQLYLRIQQAIRRDGRLAELLGPALDDITQVDGAVAGALTVIGHVWEENNVKGW